MESKFSVFFEERESLTPDQVPMIIGKFDSDLEALQFAMSLHAASNVMHRVLIQSPSGEKVCTLSKF